jgi:hypothetical protein
MGGNMAKEYKVRCCKENTNYGKGKGTVTIETIIETVPESEAEFFGVYEVQPDGTDEWVADFLNWDDAQLFALEKEKEEVK